MRILCVDASAINGGPTTRALDAAARSASGAGADVRRVRLYDLYPVTCSGCAGCAVSGRCNGRDARLDEAALPFSEADALVVGAASGLNAPNPVAAALLERMMRAFAGLAESQRRPVLGPSRAGLHVSVLVPCHSALSPAVRLGTVTGGAAAVKRACDRCGLPDVEFVPVARRLVSPGASDRLLGKSRAVGEHLATAPAAYTTNGTFSERTRRAERHRKGAMAPLSSRYAAASR